MSEAIIEPEGAAIMLLVSVDPELPPFAPDIIVVPVMDWEESENATATRIPMSKLRRFIILPPKKLSGHRMRGGPWRRNLGIRSAHSDPIQFRIRDQIRIASFTVTMPARM